MTREVGTALTLCRDFRVTKRLSSGTMTNAAQHKRWPYGVYLACELVFQDFHFVAIGIGDEGHFEAARGEFSFPVARPDIFPVDFEHLAIFDDVVDTEAGVHEVFGEFDFEVWRVGELEGVGISRELQVDDLIARGAFVVPLQNRKAAVFAVPVD